MALSRYFLIIPKVIYNVAFREKQLRNDRISVIILIVSVSYRNIFSKPDLKQVIPIVYDLYMH